MSERGFFHAGSGKSMARLLYAIIVVGVIVGFDLVCWRRGDINGSWAAIIGCLTGPLGAAWVWGKVSRSANAPQSTQSGAQDQTGSSQ